MKRWLVLALLLLWAATGFAASVRLAWDANPVEENVTGYKVYYGPTSRFAQGFTSYATTVDAGNVTESQALTISDTVTTYFAATAYNGAGLESDYSAEVSYTPSVTPGTNPVVGLYTFEAGRTPKVFHAKNPTAAFVAGPQPPTFAAGRKPLVFR